MLKILQKWKSQDDGSTAIEFALTAIPVIMLLIGIIELSLFFAANNILHGATESAARLIRTGQVQQAAGDPQVMFEDALCDHASIFIPCNKIQYEVITLADFSDYSTYPIQYDLDGNLDSNGFAAGGVNDVVLIRAIYRYKFITPLMGPILGDGADNSKLILSTIILQTEPYNFEEGAG